MLYDKEQALLPDGTAFSFWDCETEFTKTYYVSQTANAADDNPGSEDKPFATINRAAALLMPGERVIIGAGVYDEFVRPARGGESAAKMISYEAAPGERVVITGARKYQNGWKKPRYWSLGQSGGKRRDSARETDTPVYEGHFEQGDFERVNPFSMVNHPSHPWVEDFYIAWAPKAMDWMPLFQRRGLLFCDGEALTQVNSPRSLMSVPGSYWVEDSGFTFFVRLRDDSDPAEHDISYTCREQLFAPQSEGMGYIRVAGLELACVGNGVPGTQKGMLSTFMGHHWIIEHNKLRHANSIGIDIGKESTIRDGRGLVSGGTIVRGNRVEDCGICGITGLGGNDGILIEDNILQGNCRLDLQFNWESAAIKVHGVKNGLIRHNIIVDTLYGNGIWTDWANTNERICYNYILNTKAACHAAIHIEASDGPNRVDHNVIIDCKTYRFQKDPAQLWEGGHGIIAQDTSELYADRNIIIDTEGEALDMRTGSPERIFDGHGMFGVGHKVTENLIARCKRAIVFSNTNNFSDGNRIDVRSLEKPPIAIEPKGGAPALHSLRSAARYLQWEEKGRAVSLSYTCDLETMTIELTIGYEGKTMTKKLKIGQTFCLGDVMDFCGGQ